MSIADIITHWEKLLDSDWLRDCEFIRNLRANYRSQGQKSVIHYKCKYERELTINN